jgi:restriction endonuclease S subunit
MSDSWTKVNISQLLELSIGGVWGGDPGTDEIDVRVYRQTEFDDNGTLSMPSDAVRSITKNQLKSRTLHPGDVLMQKSAGTPTLPGRVVIVPSEIERNATCSNFLHLLRADITRCNSHFLFWLLWFNHQSGKAFEFQRGTNIKNLDLNQYLAQPVLLPPLAEQKRIVNVVSSVDSYIDALLQQADTARTARNAVLHELLSAGGDDWTGTTLGEISELVSRGRAPSYCDDDGVVVLNQKCVRYGRIFFEFARRTDTTKKPIPEWAYLKVGDTLINSTGVGTLGRASFVSCLDGPTTFDSHVTLVRPRDDSSFPQFIGMTLNFRENEIEMFAGGSTGQTELSREAVNSFPISLPPLDEQKRIVEIVSSMDDVIQTTEQAVTDAKNLRSGLLSDLLSGNHEIPASYDSLLGAA